ncbi:MAG TPA: hypothetical protein VIY53_15275 [Acidobacteriaceae bacterium]
MAIGRVRADAVFFAQPGASGYLFWLLLLLALYLSMAVWLAPKERPWLVPFPRIALTAGVAAGLVEIGGTLVEDLLPGFWFVPIAVELAIFLSWAVVAALASLRGRSLRAGIVTAMAAAGLCMAIGVCGGELTEFFLHPTPASEVSQWAEFQRSHWSDAASFQIANTMDSATTHLVMAPFVAFILGSAGAAIGSAKRKANSAQV